MASRRDEREREFGAEHRDDVGEKNEPIPYNHTFTLFVHTIAHFSFFST
jgi:hypothetical protein